MRWNVANTKSHGVTARNLCVGAMALVVWQSACERIGPRGAMAAVGTVTLVNRVRAEVRCTTIATCVPNLGAALRPRLEPAEITLSADTNTIDLKFERTASVFSSASFRQAVTEAGGEVTKLGIEACGTISQTEGRSWITSGSTRLLLDGTGPFEAGVEICVTGELRDQTSPPTLVPRLKTFGF